MPLYLGIIGPDCITRLSVFVAAFIMSEPEVQKAFQTRLLEPEGESSGGDRT
jgi:hypothetical protein